jgi:hypothetical protein
MHDGFYVETNIVINGTVSESGSGLPVEGVKLLLKGYNASGNSVLSQDSYTDSQGTFNLKSVYVNKAIRCTIATDHKEYSSMQKEIIINWSGTSFDHESRTFYVNDCDFHIERVR